MVDLETMAIRFVTDGDDKVKSALDDVHESAGKVSKTLQTGIGEADKQMGHLFTATQHVGNELGGGFHSGIIRAGKGVAEVAAGVQAYVKAAMAAAGATTVLASAQTIALATTRALGAAMAAVGGPIGVALIAALLAMDKITGSLEQKTKDLEDAYERIRDSTQKVYEQLVAGEVGWNNTIRAIFNAEKQLEAYRRGGERSLDTERDRQKAFSAARAQWEGIPGNLKQASDAALLADASFRQMYDSALRTSKIERQLSDAVAGKKLAEDVTKSGFDIAAALQTQKQANTKFFQETVTALDKNVNDQAEVIRKFNSWKLDQQIKEDEAALANYQHFIDETNRMIEDQFNARMDRQQREREQIAGQIADGFSAAFERAFSGGGVGGAIEAFGAVILQGFGNILIQMGTVALAAAPFLESIRTALATLSGGNLAIAGLGLIAAGALVGGIASSIGRAAGGSSSSGRGAEPSGSYTQITFGQNAAQATGNLSAARPIAFTVIGTRDPVAQRQIVELIDNASRRGG